MVRANSALTELMEREVSDATGMPIAWYDVLVNLYLAPGKAMRMSDLANKVLTSRSWLTRRVDQLELLDTSNGAPPTPTVEGFKPD